MGDTLLNLIAAKHRESKLFSKWKSPERFRRIGYDYGLFFSQSVRSFSVTASLFPSSRFLAAALLRPIDFGAARVVVELGFGTGAITNEILRRLRPNSVLLAIDLNPVFLNHVRQKLDDERLIPVLGRAERLGYLMKRHGIERADAIVSSLGLTGMRPSQRSSILSEISKHLRREGVLTQYQYLHASGEPNWVSSLGLARFAERDFLRSHFRHVASERVIWNLPPATVYTCRF